MAIKAHQAFCQYNSRFAITCRYSGPLSSELYQSNQSEVLIKYILGRTKVVWNFLSTGAKAKFLGRNSEMCCHQSKEGKGQESIQSSITPDLGHHILESDNNRLKHHMQESQVVSHFPADGHKAARNRQVRKTARIKNRYNQVPHMYQDINWKVTK